MKQYGALNNYIEMHRNRAGLSRDELSLLLSVDKSATLSRYEQGERMPDIERLIALEMALGVPLQQLFAGVAERVQESVSSRAAALLESLDDEGPSPELALKISTLARLAKPDDLTFLPLCDGE